MRRAENEGFPLTLDNFHRKTSLFAFAHQLSKNTPRFAPNKSDHQGHLDYVWPLVRPQSVRSVCVGLHLR